MIRPLDGSDLVAVIDRVQQMVPNGRVFDDGWLSSVGAKVVAEVAGTVLDRSELAVLVDAAGRAGATGMLVVTCEPGLLAWSAVRTDLSVAELERVQEDFQFIGYVVMPIGADLPVVLREEYHPYVLFAGSGEFLREMSGDLQERRAEFGDGDWGMTPGEVRDLGAVARLMDWIDDEAAG